MLTSADFIGELDKEELPAILLLTGDSGEAVRLSGLPVWGVLPQDASAEELSAALHALAEGLWVGSPALVQGLLEQHGLPALEEAEQVVDHID